MGEINSYRGRSLPSKSGDRSILCSPGSGSEHHTRDQMSEGIGDGVSGGLLGALPMKSLPSDHLAAAWAFPIALHGYLQASQWQAGMGARARARQQ